MKRCFAALLINLTSFSKCSWEADLEGIRTKHTGHYINVFKEKD
jgi:hypothetical protein